STRTSTAATAVPPSRPDPGPASPSRALRGEARAGALLLRRHGWRLVLLFAGLLLPLWGFAELADEVQEAEGFAFDLPILHVADDLARAGFDRLFLLFSALGYAWGVVPADIVLVLALAWRRHY